MSKEHLETFPLRPGHSAAVVHGLCLALVDLVEEEAGGDTPRRAFLKMAGIATAAEVVARDVAHFFGSRMHEDHDALESLQDRYLEETPG